MEAFCWASGEIDFAPRVPFGALPIASGPAKRLREKVGVKARLAYDNETLLVPGIPEATSTTAAVDALVKWIRTWAESWKQDGLQPSIGNGRLMCKVIGGAS